MKKVIVLSALLVTASVTLTSCWNTANQPEPADAVIDSVPQPEPVAAPVDALPQEKLDSSATVTPDTVDKKK